MSLRLLPRSLVEHFGWLHTLGVVLGDRLRRRALRITALSLLDAALELLSIGSVVPLLALAASPESSAAQQTMSYLTVLFGPLQRDEALIIVGLAMATIVTSRAAVKLYTLVAKSRFTCDIRVHIANRLLKGYANESYERQLRASPGRRLTLVTGDTANVASLTSDAIAVVGASVTVVAMVAIMFALDWRISLGAAVVGTLISGATYLGLSRRLRSLGELVKVERFAMTTLAARLLQGFSETAIYDRDNKVAAEFEKHSLVFADLVRWFSILRRLPVIAVEWLLAIGVVAGVCVIATLAEFASALPIAVAFAAAVLRLGPAAVTAISSAAQLRFHLSSLYEINKELKALTAGRATGRQTGAPVTFREELSFENISFRYQYADMPAVSGLNMTVRHGTMLAVCGPSGAGKSTLVNLLLGLLSPTEGEVRIDGMSIRGREGDWQRLIALVPQDPFFWNASLKENLLYGRSFSDADARIQYALETAQLASFVESLPKGVDTTIGERGALISGGQRQRLAIARALVADPELLVLDEPTSALDQEIAQAIDDALVDLKGKKTVVIVAHRPTSIARCDHVLYVEGGRITGEGSFEALARTHRDFKRTLGFAPDVPAAAVPPAAKLERVGAKP